MSEFNRICVRNDSVATASSPPESGGVLEYEKIVERDGGKTDTEMARASAARKAGKKSKSTLQLFLSTAAVAVVTVVSIV